MFAYDVDTTRLTIRTDRGLIALEPRTARTIRIRYTLEDALSQKESLAVLPSLGAPSVVFHVEESPKALILSTDALSVEIDRRTLAFTYRDSAGSILTREPARGGKSLDTIPVVVSVFEEATLVESHENADGVRVEAVNIRQVVDRHAYHTKLEFEWADGEALYGLSVG